jgi:toxin-antitoxin system PIN domain toxin
VTILLDGNVLIALAFPEHEHASRARPWFAALDESFATCPITQGSLVRFLLRQRSDVTTAKAVLASFTDLPNHLFWPDSIGYGDVRMAGVVGHSQVTDAYLAQLARSHRARLATFDERLTALHSDLSELIG